MIASTPHMCNKMVTNFDIKMSANQFFKIRYISQTVHQKKLKVYMDILDTWNYIFLIFQVKWIWETYYFKELNLLDKSIQIYQTRPLCTIWDISEAINRICCHSGWFGNQTSQAFQPYMVGPTIHLDESLPIMCKHWRFRLQRAILAWRLCFYYFILFIYLLIIIF